MQLGAGMSALGDGRALLSALVLKEGSCRQSWETNGCFDGRVEMGREGEEGSRVVGSPAHSPSSPGPQPRAGITGGEWGRAAVPRAPLLI